MLDQQTMQKLSLLGLKGMLKAYENQVQQPSVGKLSFEERFCMLIDTEVSTRNTSRIHRLLKAAKFRHSNACIEDIIYKPKRNLVQGVISSLSDCNWINEHQAIIITGATGVGKSWLACALGVQACRNQFTAAYLTAPMLLENVHMAMVQGTLSKLRRSLVRLKLLIIDDLGIGGIESKLGPVILEIIDQQSINGGLIITSQFPPDRWYDLFNDPTVADAILDRIVHRAHRIELKGESMRKMRKQNI